MSDNPTPPSITGNDGVHFEARVGAFYSVGLLLGAEPRGLRGATTTGVAFQQRHAGRPLDDVVVYARDADGTKAVLEIQVKRRMTFAASDEEFKDVVARMWEASQRPDFGSGRYELAVALAQTTTKIEQHLQEVLTWARETPDAASFHVNVAKERFSSAAARSFVQIFTDNLVAAGAPADPETVWRLLRRFQILPFDFMRGGADYEHRAVERCRYALVPEQAADAGDLWNALIVDAERAATTAVQRDRPTLVASLTLDGFQLSGTLEMVRPRELLDEMGQQALDAIDDRLSGQSLPRATMLEQINRLHETAHLVVLKGAGGTGKSAVLKRVAAQVRLEGTAIVLRPGRIPAGGGRNFAQQLGWGQPLRRLMNELGASGAATLFIDNIDQIDGEGERATVTDLMAAVATLPGWRILATAGEDGGYWKPTLPEGLTQATYPVEGLSDAEADALSAGSPALALLLSPEHPAKAIARNLFYLSQMIALGTAVEDGAPGISSEIDLAKVWWSYGGGKENDKGRLGRIKVLTTMALELLAAPARLTSRVDQHDAAAIADLIRLGALREMARGQEVAFRHDVLRDWSLGFTLHDRPEALAGLDKAGPLPGTLARGLELAARLSLHDDPTGRSWQDMLAVVSTPPTTGSWRRPVLMALPRSEAAFQLFGTLKVALLADNGQLLGEVVRLFLAVETETFADRFKRYAPTVQLPAGADTVSVPKGTAWLPLLVWLIDHAAELPDRLIPDLARLFQSWLVFAHSAKVALNRNIVEILFAWLARFDAAAQSEIWRRGDARPPTVDVEHFRDAHELVKASATLFAEHAPVAARQYMGGVNGRKVLYADFQEFLKNPGGLAKAAPEECARYVIKGLLEPDEDDDDGWHDRREQRPLGIYDHFFSPPAPSRPPFFDILEASPKAGLNLVRRVVEQSTAWRSTWYGENGLPQVRVVFPDGQRTFAGDAQVYALPRNMYLGSAATSALMALEAWAHARLDAGADPQEVFDAVLGPDGSSLAFLSVGVDLALSHWGKLREIAWPLLTSPQLLVHSYERLARDLSKVDNFTPFDQEPAHAKVRRADLDARPSRRTQLLDAIAQVAHASDDAVRQRVRDGLEREVAIVLAAPSSDDDDAIGGIRAVAKRALRMVDPANWEHEEREVEGGGRSSVRRLVLDEEDERKLAERQAEATAHSLRLTMRLRIERVFGGEASLALPELASIVDWARKEPHQIGQSGEFESDWDGRVVVMAAALAAGEDIGDENGAWAMETLRQALLQPDKERYGNSLVSYSASAIATSGVLRAYRKALDPSLFETILRCAARDDAAILRALVEQFRELAVANEALLRSIVRVVMTSARYVNRYDHDAAADAAQAQLAAEVAAAIEAELAWLAGEGGEPAWPVLPPWLRRKREIRRIPGPYVADDDYDEDETEADIAKDMFRPAEARLGQLVAGLKHVLHHGTPQWLCELTSQLLSWTLSDNGEVKVERAYTWQSEFFDFVGALCAVLPDGKEVGELVGQVCSQADDAFHEASASLLRGFDSMILWHRPVSPPNDLSAVRRQIARRLSQTWNYERIGREKGTTSEFKAGDALTAMYFQLGQLSGGMTILPENWPELPIVMPVLAELVRNAPLSGYLAALFLKVIETSIDRGLVDEVATVVRAWADAYGPDTSFWVTQDVGGRFCRWFGRYLDGGGGTDISATTLKSLVETMDVLIRAGVPAARVIESRLNG